MTQAQADEAMSAAEKYTVPMLKIAGAVGGFVMSIIKVFGWAFLMWLIGRTALKTGLATLLQHQVPSAQLADELLLMHTLGCDRGRKTCCLRCFHVCRCA